MPKQSNDWSTLAAAIAGGVIGAGATAATLNKQIQTLKTQLVQWQSQAARLQAERDQLAGRVAFAEANLRGARETETKLRTEVARLSKLVESLQSKK